MSALFVGGLLTAVESLKIKLLIDDTYTFNILIKCILTQSLLINNKMELEYYDKCNELIDEYNYNFNTDVELLKVIINLYTKTTNQDNKFFLYKLIKSQEKYGSCSKNHDKIITILKNIDKIENLKHLAIQEFQTLYK